MKATAKTDDKFTKLKSFTPDLRDERICFGIAFFYDEATADAYSQAVRECGRTYNGGWAHGTLCGRDKSFDHDGPMGRLYAVTH